MSITISRWESRLLVNPDHPRGRIDAIDIAALQESVMLGIPSRAEKQARERHDMLWRLHSVATDADRYLTIIVRMLARPDWSRLPHGYLIGRPAVTTINDLYRWIEPDMVVPFNLLANPSKRISIPGDRRDGKRVALRTDDERSAWLRRQGMQHGFEPVEIEQASRKLAGRRGRRTVTYGATEFSGLLRVTDPIALMDAFISGIGPGKAFGHGLLFIDRPGIPAPGLHLEPDNA